VQLVTLFCRRDDPRLEASAAVREDIPHFDVRKSGMPNIIDVLAGQVSHGG
jgi:hypothetical protein